MLRACFFDDRFEKDELIEGIDMIHSYEVADLMLEYCEEGQLVITL